MTTDPIERNTPMNFKIAAPAAAAMLGLTCWTFVPASKSSADKVAEAKAPALAEQSKFVTAPSIPLPAAESIKPVAAAPIVSHEDVAAAKPIIEEPVAKPEVKTMAPSLSDSKPVETKKSTPSTPDKPKKDDPKKNGDGKKGPAPAKKDPPKKQPGAGNRGAKKQPPPKAPPKGRQPAKKDPNNGGD
jgi:hypothetical protein